MSRRAEPSRTVLGNIRERQPIKIEQGILISAPVPCWSPQWSPQCSRGIPLDPTPDPRGLASGLEGLVLVGDRRSQCPLPFVPLGYRVTTNPQPLPYSLYEGRCIRCPGFTLWQSTSLKRTRRSSRVSLEVLVRSTKGEQIRN